jgi:hypothetical protein
VSVVSQVDSPATVFGSTTYLYFGNTVKITDAKGKWKTLTLDAFGNVTQVEEPKPGVSGASYFTYYTYSVLNKLTNVSMTRDGITQTREWRYNPTTQLLDSDFYPESGTTNQSPNYSKKYYYRASDLKLDYTIDAKGQRTDYTYEGEDTPKRLTKVTHTISGVTDGCQEVNYVYDTGTGNNLKARVAKTTYLLPVAGTSSCGLTGQVTEEYSKYSYHAAGAMTAKRVRLTRGSRNALLDANMTYDNEGRLASLQYPNSGMTVGYGHL